jgi:hypothetical protein
MSANNKLPVGAGGRHEIRVKGIIHHFQTASSHQAFKGVSYV